MKTVTIIDDNPIDTQLFKNWLENDKRYRLINVYHSGIDALAHSDYIKTDFCLIDARMPLLNGVDTTLLLLQKGYQGKVLLISHAYYFECMLRGREVGAYGYCSKEKQTVLSTLAKIESEDQCFDEIHFQEWGNKADANTLQQKDKDPKVDLLNPHHHKILSYSCKGLSTEEIGELMNLKKHTVEQYRASMLQLLGFTSLAQATAWAVANYVVKHGDVYTPPQS